MVLVGYYFGFGTSHPVAINYIRILLVIIQIESQIDEEIRCIVSLDNKQQLI